MMIAVTRPPSMDPARGIRALEVATHRLDTVQRQLGSDVPPAQVSLGLSNVAAMFQQALTIGEYNLPGHGVNAGFQQAMDGTLLLARQLKAGTAPPLPDIERQIGGWRAAAADGIEAFEGASQVPATP